MVEIKNAVVSFEAGELMELERIITDNDERAAFEFVKKHVYWPISISQQGRLKSHIDSANPVDTFVQHRVDNR